MKRYLLLSVLVFFCLSNLSAQIDYRVLPEWSVSHKDSTQYFLYTPAKSVGKSPLVLFLHGCCGTDYTVRPENIVAPPIRMWHAYAQDTQAIPTYIMVPKTTFGWNQHFANIKSVIDSLIAVGLVDPQRIYVSGFSMGGFGTYQIIQAYPDYFAAAIPMGMGFSGDYQKLKQFPMWMNQGETDFWSQQMRKNVDTLHGLNGFVKDSGSTEVTGVFPRYSNFRSVGHGVQWQAASTQDLTGWAYQQVKDGNKAPVVYFDEQMPGSFQLPGTRLEIPVTAFDPDGEIKAVHFYVNDKKYAHLKQPPYQIELVTKNQSYEIRAVAEDQSGKKSTASRTLKYLHPPVPVFKTTMVWPIGGMVNYTIPLTGNAPFWFSVDSSTLPEGLFMYSNGNLRGVPQKRGAYTIRFKVRDAAGLEKDMSLAVKLILENRDELFVHPVDIHENSFRLEKIHKTASPFFFENDSVYGGDLQEINISDAAIYNGMLFLQTNSKIWEAPDSIAALHFQLDQPAIVYVAYETYDSIKSTVPAWLDSFEKLPQQIIAQYRYYDVYRKKFPKGEVILNGADRKKHGVATGYFVLIGSEK